jgi:putative ABC transport system substrate-binding protein
MRRRDFIAFLGGTACAWPAAARAQKSNGMRRIGVLMSLAAEDPQGQEHFAAFRQALQKRGWTEGGNVRFDPRWAAGDPKLGGKYAAELVALAPDVILAGSGLVVAPLRQATRTVPIVFAGAIDPVSRGYVVSLPRPGGNITGFLNIEFGFSAKWLELLKQIAPGVTRAAVLGDPGVIGLSQFRTIEELAPSLHVNASAIDVDDEDEIERAIAAFAREANGGLIVTTSIASTLHRGRIVDLAAGHRLPAVYPNRFYVEAGGLISYGPVYLDLYRRAADYVDRILRGAKPADLPVQAPVMYEMVLNRGTANALGLDVPIMVNARVTQVIE